ncbi:T9SS type A sorting domain-containing protein [Hymenobacter sp. BT664]|uniref:T9SS type A sorting domain-containing protein n=1 Tax=Hymenobacter montanus TaxID=2771359 RepID=A0A927GKK3_9BACT|nr:T9SS type A sorting domain-containing protein [Hymenobacter montanus]MBD2769254.1 T9SS type A sorting domain-containing protein [Hymenobacter montanus]
MPLVGFGQNCSNQITVSYYNSNGTLSSQTINNGQSGTSVSVCPTAGAIYSFDAYSTSDGTLTWARVISKAVNPAQDVVQVLATGVFNAPQVLRLNTSFTTATQFRVSSDPNKCGNNKIGYAYLTFTPALTLASTPATGVCVGGTATLTAGGSSSYTWSANGVVIPNQTGSTLTVNPTVTTTYTVSGTTSCGTSSQQITVPVKDVTISPSAPVICAGQTTRLTASYNGTSATYRWFVKGQTTVLSTSASVDVAPSSTTTYQVVATTSDCSTITKEVTVTVGAPTVSITPGTATICAGSSTTLRAISNNPNATFSWSPATGLSATSGATVTASPTVNTTYTVTATTPCGTVSASVPVTVATIATFAVSPTASTTCSGSSTTFTASSNISDATYAWYATSNLGVILSTAPTLTVAPTTTTSYRVITTTSCGNNSRDVTVTVNPLPTINVTPSSATIKRGGFVSLTASGASTYTWSPSTGLNTTSGATVIASPTTTTTYSVVGTTSGTPACSNSAQVTITVTQPLPVQLLAFAARRTGSKALLTWTTASELNSAFFAVERSKNGVDFAPLAQVPAAGTSAQIIAYAFTDLAPLKELAYYRLRQVDRDGTSTYSPLAALAAPPAADWLLATDAPQQFLIQAPLDAASRLTVLDLLGRPLFSQALSPEQTHVTLPNLPTGVYLFRLTTQHARLTVRQALSATY